MVTKLSAPKTSKIKVISFILIVAVCLTMIPILSFGESPKYTKDVTSDITFSDVIVSSGGVVITTESTGQHITAGDEVEFSVDWAVENTKNLVEGSGFRVLIPPVFTFTPTNRTGNLSIKINGVSTTVANYNIVYDNKNYYMEVVFTRDVSSLTTKIFDGYLLARGQVGWSNEGEFDGTQYDIPYPSFTIDPVMGDFDGVSMPSSVQLEKDGWLSDEHANGIEWRIDVNYDNYLKKLMGETYKTTDKLIITDNLGPNLKFINYDDEANIPIEISVPMFVYNPTNGVDSTLSGKPSAYVGAWYPLNVPAWGSEYDKVKLLTQTSGESYQSFYNRVVANTPSYGIYNENQLIVNLGSLPNSNLTFFSKTDFEESLKSWSAPSEFKVTDAQKAEMKQNYINGYNRMLKDSNNRTTSNMQVVGLSIRMLTEYIGEMPQKEGEYVAVNNTVSMGALSDKSDNVYIQYIEGGASGLSPGEIELIKKDKVSGETLSGVTFRLERKNSRGGYDPMGQENTDANGKINVKGLDPGDYRLVEVGDVTGYKSGAVTFEKEDGTQLTNGKFKINSGDTVGIRIIAYNDPIPGSIELTKYGVDGKTTLNGGTFELKDSSGNVVKTTTAVDGKVTFGGLTWGAYTINEKVAPQGYDKDSFKIRAKGIGSYTDAKNYTINVDGEHLKLELDGSNTGKDGIFEFTKTDDSTGAKLSGGAFTLTDTTTNKVVATKSAIGGKVTFTGLPWGTYKLKEVTAPEGYEPFLYNGVGFGNDWTITINDKTMDKNYKVYASATNKKIPEDFYIGIEKFTKEDGSKYLAGAEFKLYSNSACTEEVYANFTAVSDGKGIVTFPAINAGTYYIKEVKSPSGYKLLSNPIKIEIVKSNGGAMTGGYILKVDGTTVSAISGDKVTRIQNGDTAVIAVENYKGFNLPMTGGMGILMFLAIGLIGILSVSIVVMRRKRKVTA